MTISVGAVAGPVLLVLGAVLAVVGIVLSRRDSLRRNNWVAVSGRVVRETDQPAGMVEQHIGYRHAGKKYEMSRRISGALSAAGGVEVELLVDPARPERAVVPAGTGPRAIGFALVLTGFIAVVIGLFFLLSGR